MELIYYCVAIYLIAWLSWPLVISEFHAKRKGPSGSLTRFIFFLLRKLGLKKDAKTRIEEFVADSSRISESAPPSLGSSNRGKPFVGKDPGNGRDRDSRKRNHETANGGERVLFSSPQD